MFRLKINSFMKRENSSATTSLNLSPCKFSFDGINDHFVLPTLGQLIIDVSSDEFQENGFIISNQTQMYVKGTVASGSVYISAFYARGT